MLFNQIKLTMSCINLFLAALSKIEIPIAGMAAGCSALLRMLFLYGFTIGNASADYDNLPKQIPVDRQLTELISAGENLRNEGNLAAAQQKFDSALRLAATEENLPKELLTGLKIDYGYNQFLMNDKDAAERQLKDAYTATEKGTPYLHALAGEYLASISLSNGANDDAADYVEAAIKSAKTANAPALAISLAIMQLGLASDQTLADGLPDLADRIERLPDDLIKANLQLLLGQNVLDLDVAVVEPAKMQSLYPTAYRAFEAARNAAETADRERLKAEALTGLARLYRRYARNDEAFGLIGQALVAAGKLNAKELLAQLEAEKGDLLALRGEPEAALNAYENAVYYLHGVRADLPLTLPDGRSAVSVLIDPIYRRYTGMLLKIAEGKTAADSPTLIKAIDNMEVIKEADMQDFFLAKCSINPKTRQDWQTKPLANAAIIYPIVLDDRLELLMKTDRDFHAHTLKIPAVDFKKQLQAFSAALTNDRDYQASARQLYDWLVKPIKVDLEKNQIKTLVYVPDHDMRSIPYAALNDGNRFVVEDYAIVTLPSLVFHGDNIKNTAAVQQKQLFAGLSKADGPSIDQLPKKIVAALEEEAKQEGLIKTPALQRSVLSDTLSLPGVEKELDILAQTQNSKVLLNDKFTATSFKSDLESGEYNKVHVATHGFFGNNAKDSFIMAYDSTLSLDTFQHILTTDRLREKPIELLTLSACETAEGNDRLLLGFSGMAIRSNVLSALGSLWSINDEGTMAFMKAFYNGLNKAEAKAQALREAQIAMIKSEKFKRPYYWSPFILTGSWE